MLLADLNSNSKLHNVFVKVLFVAIDVNSARCQQHNSKISDIKTLLSQDCVASS